MKKAASDVKAATTGFARNPVQKNGNNDFLAMPSMRLMNSKPLANSAAHVANPTEPNTTESQSLAMGSGDF